MQPCASAQRLWACASRPPVFKTEVGSALEDGAQRLCMIVGSCRQNTVLLAKCGTYLTAAALPAGCFTVVDIKSELVASASALEPFGKELAAQERRRQQRLAQGRAKSAAEAAAAAAASAAAQPPSAAQLQVPHIAASCCWDQTRCNAHVRCTHRLWAINDHSMHLLGQHSACCRSSRCVACRLCLL